MAGWRFADVGEFSATLLTLFGYMNVLYERVALSEEMNRRVSEEVAQLLQEGWGGE